MLKSVFVLLSFAGMTSVPFSAACAGERDCLDGAYDFGPQAAVVSFECLQTGDADIRFCSRATYLASGNCTGVGAPVRCAWSDVWTCSESENNFKALLSRVSDYAIEYKFSSDFNDGDLIGHRILK